MWSPTSDGLSLAWSVVRKENSPSGVSGLARGLAFGSGLLFDIVKREYIRSPDRVLPWGFGSGAGPGEASILVVSVPRGSGQWLPA